MSGGEEDKRIMNTQVEIHRAKSEYSEARNIQTWILHNTPIDQNPSHHALALINLAQIDVETSASRHDVQKNIDTAYGLYKAIGHVRMLGICDSIQGALDLREGNLLAARALFQTRLSLTWGKDVESYTYCLEKLSDSRRWTASNHNSSTWTFTLLVHSLKLKQRRGIHKALQFLGDVYLTDGDNHTATSLFTVALDGFTQMEVHRGRAECMLKLGDISKQDGDVMKAEELWKIARPLFERSSQMKQVADVDDRLAGITGNCTNWSSDSVRKCPNTDQTMVEELQN
ncbi:hypothetical protein GGX14DRAFT_658096 [Mycena pura]|uniref:Uncharacterized protein n=1 Tax=Mycena pura TaxID=153505 RepID=A0AAD7E2C8_9AGAR|nr:hypothetical protein GGX14DRAFT_658096 [Mycena pura]